MTPERASDQSRPDANGHSNGRVRSVDGDGVVAPVVALDGAAGLEDVAWHPSYDRESVNRYLAEVEAEKARLLAEIQLAEAQADASQTRYEVSSTEREALLGSLLLAARAEIDQVDAEHRATVTAIYAMAEQESSRIRDRAQAHAAAVRDVGASLTSTREQGEAGHAG